MRNTCKSDGAVAFGWPFSGGRVRNTWMTYPAVGDSLRKRGIIPHAVVPGDRHQES